MKKIKFLQHKKLQFKATVLCCYLLTSTQAWAAVCGASASSVNFGSYNVYSSGAAQTVGSITIVCNPLSTSYSIALDGGLYGTIAQRKQSSGSDLLLYNLYTDAAHSSLWGDGSTNGVTVTSSGSVPVNVYGSMPAHQNVGAGNYSDSVSVTVTF